MDDDMMGASASLGAPSGLPLGYPETGRGRALPRGLTGVNAARAGRLARQSSSGATFDACSFKK